MPSKRKLIDKIKYESEIAKEYFSDYAKMTPTERKKDHELKQAMKSNPIDQKVLNRGKRLDLEARVNKKMFDRSLSAGQGNKSRGSTSSATRRPMK
jgi:hypothetical protein